ncbi:hypothetical protein [Pandoraea apista]|uniref:HORMA-1 domain-containing protein n=1 Tax=Pandoraea apista TaxID=93218 RepID=UPI00058A7BE7|nr:hypothetical protein [Pandoraea apista]AJE98841.1 hypothetical protein SG18_12750 [Pandoraea apista]AKH72920.1 hypothetical protein XM39_12945 [Pandoraea apista]AKI61305.1 hypothetical protein AA956_05205 [Pandoraea apista]
MSATQTTTYTSTFTIADVEIVVRNIQADLVMIASSTKAMSESDARDYAHDIELLAKKSYLDAVDVTLLSAAGKEVKAATYSFLTGDDANGSARPGGVRWPETLGGRIRIVLKTNDTYKSQPDDRKNAGCKHSWVSTSTDTSHGGLSVSGGRGYSSNGFGADRKDFS